MASVLNLDLNDPGVRELVKQWQDGGQYSLELMVTQMAVNDKVATFEVTEVVDATSDMEPEETEEVEPAPAAPPKGPKTFSPAKSEKY